MAHLPHLIPPNPSSLADFPVSSVTTVGIQTIPAEFDSRLCTTHLNIEYAHKSGIPLHLHIIEPDQTDEEDLTFPLVVFIPGSAWFQQSMGGMLAQLSRFAQRGYVIALVEYRPSPVAPFPAQIRDTRSAIRFLRANAQTYNLEPNDIIVWGTSSGGHTAVMAGITLEDAIFDDESDKIPPKAIKAVIDFYGPTDISKMNEEPSTMDHIAPESPEGMLIGGQNVLANRDLVFPTVPMNHLAAERNIPPILIMHGDKDRLVPFGQSVMLFDALKAAQKTSECYQLAGADHGGPPFWTKQILDIVESFIQNSLGR